MLVTSPITDALSLRGSNPVRTRAAADLTAEKKQELEKLRAVCKDFESIFSFQLMKEMRKTVQKGRFIHGGMAEEVFSDMLDQERTKGLAFGLGDILFQQLSRAVIPAKRPL